MEIEWEMLVLLLDFLKFIASSIEALVIIWFLFLRYEL